MVIENSILITRGENSPPYLREAIAMGRGNMHYEGALPAVLGIESGRLGPKLFSGALVEAPRRSGLRWDLDSVLDKIANSIPTVVCVTQGVAHAITTAGSPSEGWEVLVDRLVCRGDVGIIVAPPTAHCDDFLRAWEQAQLHSIKTTTKIGPRGQLAQLVRAHDSHS